MTGSLLFTIHLFGVWYGMVEFGVVESFLVIAEWQLTARQQLDNSIFTAWRHMGEVWSQHGVSLLVACCGCFTRRLLWQKHSTLVSVVSLAMFQKIIHLSIHLLPQIVEEEEEGENLDGGKVEDFKTSRKSSSKENSIQEKVKKSEPLSLGKDGVWVFLSQFSLAFVLFRIKSLILMYKIADTSKLLLAGFDSYWWIFFGAFDGFSMLLSGVLWVNFGAYIVAWPLIRARWRRGKEEKTSSSRGSPWLSWFW